MRLVLCGVRGSTPAPGPAFVRYGGHTSCVALAHDGEAPSLVLDAGTGLQRLTEYLGGAPFQGTLLLGHLHWDHTHGLPFFRAGDQPESRVDLYLPEQGVDAEELLARAISPPHFPIRPRELRGSWTFRGLEPGEHSFEGFAVTAMEIPHKGGRTFGYRVSDGRVSIAYLSDHWPLGAGPGPRGDGEYHEAALALASGVDLLLHDAQYTQDEFPARAHFGHTTVDYAAELGEKAGAARVMLFHHDPGRTDDDLDEVLASLAARHPGIEAAREGAVIDL